MKGRATKVAKLVLVAALMALVFTGVHWRDRLVYRDRTAGTVLHEVPGRVIGGWDEAAIRFLPATGGLELHLQRGLQADGTELELVPGFLTYWRNVDLPLFVLGALCYFVTVLVAGTRWWWLLRVNGMGVSLAEALRFTWIGLFFNNVVPGQTGGDLIKALYIMKRCPGHRVPALVSVIVDRVLGLMSLAILAAVVVLFALDQFAAMAVVIWSVMGGVALLGAVAFSRRLRQLVRLKALLEKLPHRAANLLKLVDQAVFFYRGHKRVILGSLVAGVGNHVISVLSVVFIGEALGVGLPRFEYFVLIPVIHIASALPIAPNGWGVGEWLYQSLFAEFGAKYVSAAVDPAQVMGTRGVALSVLYRLHLTLWSLCGGLLVLLEKDRVTRADVQHEVEIEEQEGMPTEP